ncbi:MAG: hypothetical protein AAFO07_34135 [Bacteroidota bacterium]
MNKASLIILPLVFFLNCSSNTKTFYDSNLKYYELEYWGLTGSVKLFGEKGFFRNENAKDIDLNNLALEEDFRFSSKQDYSFNKEGLMTEQNYYTSEEKLSWQLLNFYDNRSRLIENIVFEGDKTVRYFQEFIYDNVGNQTQEITYKKDSTVQLRKIFTYNELNQETEEKWTERKSGPQVHRIYEYNNEGRVKIMRYSDGQNDLKLVYTYTQSGDPASIITYKPDETISKKEIFEYQAGRLIEKINTNYKKGTKDVLQFNTKGLLSKIERFKSDDDEAYELDKYLYEYDERGNWIQKATFKNGDLFHIAFRDIEYF